MASCTKYRRIAPKPPGFQVEQENIQNKKISYFERIKITRKYMYKVFSKELNAEDFPFTTRNEMASKRNECCNQIKLHENDEIIPQHSSESSYFWKCVLLSVKNWKILENISKKYKLTTWKVRCLLEGIQGGHKIQAALELWNKYEREPPSAQLAAINKKIKMEGCKSCGDEGKGGSFNYDLETAHYMIEVLQKELKETKQENAELSLTVKRHTQEKQTTADLINGLKRKISVLEDNVSTLEDEVKLLRFARKMQDERLKTTEKKQVTNEPEIIVKFEEEDDE